MHVHFLACVFNDQHSETYQANDFRWSSCAIGWTAGWFTSSFDSIANEGLSKAREEWGKNLLLWVTPDLPHPLSLPSPVNIAKLLLSPYLTLPLLFSYLDIRQEKLRIEAGEASTGRCSAGPTRLSSEGCGSGTSPLASVVLVVETEREVKMGKRAKITVNIPQRNVTT